MRQSIRAALAILAFVVALPASATFHLWTMNELYSNADGSVQFLELTALSGGQQFMAGHTLTATGGGSTRTFNFETNLASDSAGRRMLIGTQGFAALGVVAPDYIVPNGFFTISGGSINFGEFSDVWNYGALPGGNLSLNRDGGTAVNSPRNFAGATGTVSGSSGPTQSFNVQALWWRGPTESGWGINIVHQGTTLFATWFTYDAEGNDLWLFMDNMQLTANNTYSGPVYRAAGSPFNLLPYDTSRFAATPLGTATMTFTDASNGSITWTVSGVTQTKSIIKFVYSDPVPTCAANGQQSSNVNYQDLWWRSPAGSESGWGVNIAHQGDILFITWFTYDTDGSQMWLFMDNAARTAPGVYAGNVLQSRGSPLNTIPYDLLRFVPTVVGTGTITFADANNATFNYTVKGATHSRPITRFVFSSPTTTCSFAAPGAMGYPSDPYPQ